MTISSITSGLQAAYAGSLGKSLNVSTRTGPNANQPQPDPLLPAGKQKPAADDDASTDPTDLIIKQLQEQLRQITQQMERLRASKIPDQQKVQQLQALNQEAGEIMSRIATLQEQKLQAAGAIKA